MSQATANVYTNFPALALICMCDAGTTVRNSWSFLRLKKTFNNTLSLLNIFLKERYLGRRPLIVHSHDFKYLWNSYASCIIIGNHPTVFTSFLFVARLSRFRYQKMSSSKCICVFSIFCKSRLFWKLWSEMFTVLLNYEGFFFAVTFFAPFIVLKQPRILRHCCS